jgi:hypothetical protein
MIATIKDGNAFRIFEKQVWQYFLVLVVSAEDKESHRVLIPKVLRWPTFWRTDRNAASSRNGAVDCRGPEFGGDFRVISFYRDVLSRRIACGILISFLKYRLLSSCSKLY